MWNPSALPEVWSRPVLFHQVTHQLPVSKPLWGGLLLGRFPLTVEPMCLVVTSEYADLGPEYWFWCVVCYTHQTLWPATDVVQASGKGPTCAARRLGLSPYATISLGWPLSGQNFSEYQVESNGLGFEPIRDYWRAPWLLWAISSSLKWMIRPNCWGSAKNEVK